MNVRFIYLFTYLFMDYLMLLSID